MLLARLATLTTLTTLAMCIFIATLPALPAQADSMRLCNSAEFWPPYSFKKGGRLEGEHTAILEAAFSDLGIPMEQIILPWKRCQDRVAAGELAGIIGISHTVDRGAVFAFPESATTDLPTEALSQVEFVIITRADTAAPATISLKDLPEPVGVLLGYRSADSVRGAGKQAQIVAQQSSLFQMLERGRIASAVVLRGTAIHYVEKSEEPLVIHEPALWSTPHFLAFSRNAGLAETDMQQIWAAIRTVREDKPRMARIRAKVNELLEACLASGTECR